MRSDYAERLQYLLSRVSDEDEFKLMSDLEKKQVTTAMHECASRYFKINQSSEVDNSKTSWVFIESFSTDSNMYPEGSLACRTRFDLYFSDVFNTMGFSVNQKHATSDPDIVLNPSDSKGLNDFLNIVNKMSWVDLKRGFVPTYFDNFNDTEWNKLMVVRARAYLYIISKLVYMPHFMIPPEPVNYRQLPRMLDDYKKQV